MAFTHSKNFPVSAAVCLKDTVIVSYLEDPSLQLYSSVGSSHLDSIILDSYARDIHWGIKKDIVLVCSCSSVYVLGIVNFK